MFEIIKSIFLAGKVRHARLENELEEQKIIKKYIDEGVRNTDRFKQQFEDEDEDRWMLQGNNEEKQLSEPDHRDLIRMMQKFYYKNSHARGIIRLYEKYGVGRGFSISPKTNNELWHNVWKDFWTANRMQLRKKEIVRRGMRDGEGFIRFFHKAKNTVKIRFMNPLRVKDETDKYSYGIETDPNDIETVLNYYYAGEKVPADEVIHYKILVDSDVKRGRSILEVDARPLAQYKDWISDRMKLNKIRAVMGLIRKVKGTSVEAQNIAGQNATTARKAPDSSSYFRIPEGVSVITTKPSIDYEFKTPNLQASDVQNDGYALLNQIAASKGLPNWMITSDPSNANYASSLVSEAPGVKELQDWQDFYQLVFEEIYRKVMIHAIEDEMIPEFEEVEETEIDENGMIITKKVMKKIELEPYIVFPELVHRDLLSETKALSMQRNEGALSLHTYCGKLDLDYDNEKEMIKQESEEMGEEEPDDQGDEMPEDVEDIEKEEAFKKARKEYVK